MTVERIRLEPNTDLVDVLDRVHEDGLPRVIERDGKPYVVIVNADDFEKPTKTMSRQRRNQILSMAGIWKDLNADELIQAIYEARDMAPPSPIPAE